LEWARARKKPCPSLACNKRGLQMVFQADLPAPNTFVANCG
jgi:hypothetical protein